VSFFSPHLVFVLTFGVVHFSCVTSDNAALNRIARRQRQQQRSQSTLKRHAVGDMDQSLNRTTFIPPPALSLTSSAASHVHELLKSVASTDSPSSRAPAAFSSSSSARDIDDALALSTNNLEAKQLHSLHLQQLQQKQMKHPILHPQFSSALLSRPLPHSPDNTADIVSMASTRMQ
jgi:hypothetical protein